MNPYMPINNNPNRHILNVNKYSSQVGLRDNLKILLTDSLKLLIGLSPNTQLYDG